MHSEPESIKISYETTLELIHPIACVKSELHFKGKKKQSKDNPKPETPLLFYHPVIIEGYCLIKRHVQWSIWARRPIRRVLTHCSCLMDSKPHSRTQSCTRWHQWESVSGCSSYFANSWNLVILSLEEDLADISNGRLGSSGGETDGGLLVLHTVKNYTVAPDQLLHEEKTNQHW